MVAFSDSVDTTGSYAFGICGVKTIALSVATPSFMSLTLGANQLVDVMTFTFDTSAVALADAAVYTIDYTVTFANYPGNP